MINEFIEEKLQISDASFGIVIFQEEDNPVTMYDERSADSIIEIIDDKWNTRPRSASFFENGLFEILSYIFGKSRSIEKMYRVIVLSDTASTKPDEYHNALYDLVLKSKNFSTIIDLIRIGLETQYEDEVKIKVITSETQGGTFFCTDIKQFEDVLASLIKSKREFNIVRPDEEQLIHLEEDKSFFEHLAADLISLTNEDEEICSICRLELCPICDAYSDEIRKCYNCGAKFHGCCISKYAITNNFGYKHIFRCPQCKTLLKIDEDYVALVYEEEYKGLPQIKIEEISQEDSPKEDLFIDEQIPINEPFDEISEQNNVISESQTEEIEEPIERIISEIKIDEIVKPPPSPPKFKKVKFGGFFGQEVVIEEGKALKPLKIRDLSSDKSKYEEKISITKLRPPKKRAQLKFCKICGNSVMGILVCPNCGARIE
jgi:hypothetical protein